MRASIRARIGDAIAEPMLTHKLWSRRQGAGRSPSLLERVGLTPTWRAAIRTSFPAASASASASRGRCRSNPKLIVADEAVSALDVSIKAQVVNLLLELQESSELAYLFISHDMAVVERVSHRVAVMYLGEIVEIGPRAAIFDNPQHPYTKS